MVELNALGNGATTRAEDGVSNTGGTPSDVPTSALPCETLAGFSAWQQIGRGGDAIVYRATQDELDRDVAIKILTVDDEESVRRFTREVQLMVALGRQHPNIAKVLQIGTSSLGRPCIVMDYYELGSLDQRLARTGPLSPNEVIGVGTVVADALAFAHSRGVLHRDVKPQNILVLPTSYVLADFGIARLIDSAHTASSDRFSYRHASPQVLDGCPPSGSDDVFSLGATMFHLLDGKPPFTTTDPEPDSALAYIKRVHSSEPRQLARTDVPAALAAAIQRCLRKDPCERFGSADELRDALAALATGWLGVASAPSVPLAPAGVGLGSPTTWGGIRGTTHSPADLTTMRLTRAPDFCPSTAPVVSPVPSDPRSAPSPGDSAKSSHARRFGIVLAGVILGAVLVLLWALLQPTQPPAGIPITTASPASSGVATPQRTSNPDLVPRNMTAEFVGDGVRVTWERPIDPPRRYLIGISPDRDQETILVEETLFDATSAETAVDPSWREVCVVVIAERDSETGFDRECLTR